MCVIVNLTTLRGSRDQTVVLQSSDHPFIRHQTIVLYSDARLINTESLEAEVRAGTAIMERPCPAHTLKLIQAGVFASPFTARKIQNFCSTKKQSR